MKVGDVQELELIDGCGPEPARMVKAGFMKGHERCRHCCAHTSGPQFPCCKCGAEFERLLTDAEEAEFTVLNCAAHGWLREQAPQAALPCWLCMSAEVRAQAVTGLLAYLREGLTQHFLYQTEATIRRSLETNPDLQAKCKEWRRAECRMKALRLAGNPRAFFTEAVSA